MYFTGADKAFNCLRLGTEIAATIHANDNRLRYPERGALSTATQLRESLIWRREPKSHTNYI
jgi:hypothetical protein